MSKISFIVLCNQVLSRLKVENHVKISFIVLCNQVLSRFRHYSHMSATYQCHICTVIIQVLLSASVWVKIYVVLRKQYRVLPSALHPTLRFEKNLQSKIIYNYFKVMNLKFCPFNFAIYEFLDADSKSAICFCWSAIVYEL